MSSTLLETVSTREAEKTGDTVDEADKRNIDIFYTRKEKKNGYS